MLSKRSGHFKELQKNCWKEVIYIRKLLLKKKGFLLNRDCYFKGYLLRKEILTFQSVKNYYFKDCLICKKNISIDIIRNSDGFFAKILVIQNVISFFS